ncbi:LysR family transcriptional regulator [Novosphingobium terrae]|uniref:LysR family transcriptional regulator n=1 Tax=Novosphingobium terrae TaxID=2726189 RepID=UPI001980C3C5|nr:LysR family transcriptional regulator [Novosphingobium terrae]
MQDIDWSDYQAFLAIARSGQLARAGRLAGMDATTMGRRLRKLEARLGATLFEQTREGQILTQAGDKLLLAIEQMAQAASGIEPATPGKGVSGSVRISVSEGFGSCIVARHLGAFAASHPDLSVDLAASSGFLSPSKREADVAVLLSRPKAGPLIARKLADYALRLYASPAYLQAQPPIRRPADLQSHRLTGYIPDLLYAPELNYLSEIAPGMSADLRSSSILAQHRMLASGAGVGVLPCFIGDADPTLTRVLPERPILRSFWLVTHQDTSSLRRIRAVSDWLTDIVRQEKALLLPAG